MNVSQLRAFVAVAKKKSFSGAARALGISQPAVTMQVQGLESDIGATLLDRRYRRVTLTEAGHVLLAHARGVLRQLDQAQADVDALSGTVSGRLVIGASTTPGAYLVPFALRGFIEACPKVDVSVVLGDTASVVKAVEEGEVHFGVSGATVKNAHADFAEIGRDELIVICAAENPLAVRKRVEASELAEERWIQREEGSGTRRIAEEAVFGHGLASGRLDVVAELNTGEAVVSAVEGGLGIAVVSRLVAQKALALGNVFAADIIGFPVDRPFYSVMPKTTSTRAAFAFKEHLASEIGRKKVFGGRDRPEWDLPR
ncbi:MAG: LysR substrate-binding domain-containing protein [Coriobacteriia bacterium]|nr:LysR substrate-binding domain-containing protein [Coriobacteriia bacterium]